MRESLVYTLLKLRMKKTLLALFIGICSMGFAQQNKQAIRTHFYYTILNVEDEQALQQAVDEISTYKGVSGCKSRIKPESKMAEIIFTFEERPLKAEGDKGDPFPNAKKIIIEKGLNYNGFTSEIEKLTN